MAEATLTLSRCEDGESWFEVATDPFDAPPYSGPAGTRSHGFRATCPEIAVFQWRTGADKLRDMAQAFQAGRAAADDVFGAMADAQEEFMLWQVESCLEAEGETRRAAQLSVLAPLADDPGPAESDSYLSYYHFEDDVFLHDAARSLPLPAWARVDSRGAGGPGSGYEAAFIVLAEGRSLEDLAAWIAQEPGKGRRAGKPKKPRS